MELASTAQPSCPHCQADLCQVEAMGYDKVKVFDIRWWQFEVTEHRVAIKACPGCGSGAGGVPDAVRQFIAARPAH
ncbi:MAG: IS66 family transposase zinc-finger binding domain-containing protein [Caldilineaceae bacterium]